MSITVPCACGVQLRVKDELAGKRVKCPKCGQPVVVPSHALQDHAAAVAQTAVREHSKSAVLRFDGVYQSRQDDCTSYLRFYANGAVIQVSSTGTPMEIARWFELKHDGVSRGVYTVRGAHIAFSAECNLGSVDYEGDFQGEKLKLRSHSHINGFRGEALYSFVKIDLK